VTLRAPHPDGRHDFIFQEPVVRWFPSAREVRPTVTPWMLHLVPEPGIPAPPSFAKATEGYEGQANPDERWLEGF
jgi:hypothetical protein